jgi:two-component system CheB/CheR fusion protein
MENFVVPSSTRKKRDLKTVGTYFTNNKSKPPKLDHIFDELLGEFIPPSVIIDENYDVIHTILKVNKYLSIPVGSISLNLLKMLPEEMAVMVSSLLRKAKKSSKEVIFRNLTLGGEEKVLLDVSGKMLQDKRTKEIYYIVSFLEKDWDNREQETEGGKEKIDIDFQYKERIAELEKELQYKSESLQATVEELETSNEELQSSNEELIASNEELQSTNEELQSVNEELYTVNSEYQKKLEELQELNSDMDNLLKNTNIGSLFLDQNLHIRKFTAVASKITNIMDADIGRPIHHISLNHLNNDFLADIDEVIDSLQKKESKIKTPDNYWYLVKIVPYRTAVNAVDGIIITFIDITHEVEMEQEKKKTHDLIYKTLEYNPVASTIVDKSGVITFANKKAEELFGISQKQIKERTYDASDWEITDPEGNEIDPTLLPFQQVMKTKKPVYRYQHYIKIPGKSKKLLSINGAPMFDDKGEITGVVFTLDDVTKEKEIEQQLKESEEKYKSLFNSNYDAILVADTKRKIIDANPAFERLTGYKTAEVKGRQTSDLYASENDFNKMGEKLKKFSDREGFLHVINYQKKDGTVFKGETTAFPLKNKNGNIRAFVGIIRKLNN